MTLYFTIPRGVLALAWDRGDTHVNASCTTIHTLLRAVTILWGRLVGVPSGSGRLGAPLGPAFWRHLQMPARFAACRYVGQPILSAAGFQPALSSFAPVSFCIGRSRRDRLSLRRSERADAAHWRNRRS